MLSGERHMLILCTLKFVAGFVLMVHPTLAAIHIHQGS